MSIIFYQDHARITRMIMTGSGARIEFDSRQLLTVNQAVCVAEELISDFYKLSDSQLRQLNYDVKSRSQLAAHEIVDAHFAQIVRYRARKKDAVLETDATDFYLVCLQDHVILDTIERFMALRLYPFMLYVICHELVHVVRFRRFLQNFHAPPEERQQEEIRVHHITRRILRNSHTDGMEPVFDFYGDWQVAFDQMSEII